MMCAAQLSFPKRGSNLFVFIFIEARDALMSCTQDVSFSLGRNNLRQQVWMSHPTHVLCLSSLPSPASLHSERGSSHFSGSGECSSLNIVWMINNADFLARSSQFESSLDQSVIIGIVKVMLFIGTPLAVINWRIFIQRWSSCMC